jgi:plastocyanin
MKRIAALSALAVALTAPLLAPLAPAMSQPAAAPQIATVRVMMQDRKFRPDVIRLRVNQPTRIILVNRDVSGHNFSSKGLFSHADIRDNVGEGMQAIHEGMVSVPSQSTRSILVTPRVRGPYDVNSSVALDVASGMTGQILVY